MDKHGDSVASIDVAVAFFAAVLAVFAMIEFTRPTAPQQPELPTIGPAVPTVTVTPPGWSAAQPRTVFALLAGEQLAVFDMTHFALSAGDVFNRVTDGPAGAFENYRFGRGSAVPQTDMTLAFTPDSLPPEWVRGTVQVGIADDTDCAAFDAAVGRERGRSLSVFVLPDPDTDLRGFVALATRCGRPYRAFSLPTSPEPGEVVQIRIRLSSEDYTLERMLR